MKCDVDFVMCYEKDGEMCYWLHSFTADSFIPCMDDNTVDVVRGLVSGGDLYVIGYLYNGKFFDQFRYLGKGKQQ